MFNRADGPDAGKIILLADHRQRSRDAGPAKVPPTITRPPVLFLGVFLLMGLSLAASSHRGDSDRVGSLPPQFREALQRRTLEEVESVCHDGHAASGQLRDHCISQAHFLLSFPECTGPCELAAWGVLPRTRR